MPNKLQAYAEQAERTARQITGSHLAWTAFLTTAARLYKYPYNEQLMISLTAVPRAATVRGVLKSKMLKKSSCSK